MNFPLFIHSIFFFFQDKVKEEKPAVSEEGLGNNVGLKTEVYSAHHKAQMSKAKTLAAQAVAKPWTDQEILLLLEGLELYKVKG